MTVAAAYRTRRSVTVAARPIRSTAAAACSRAVDRLHQRGEAKLLSLLDAGDQHGGMRMTWHAKATARGRDSIDDPDVATEYLDELVADMAELAMRPEVQALTGTLRRWRSQILAWHRARVTNGPTET